MVESIMGPLVFKANTFTYDSVLACKLEKIGLKSDTNEHDRNFLVQLIKRVETYIRIVYNWAIIIGRNGHGHPIDFFTPQELLVTDWIVLKPLPVEQKLLKIEKKEKKSNRCIIS